MWERTVKALHHKQARLSNELESLIHNRTAERGEKGAAALLLGWPWDRERRRCERRVTQAFWTAVSDQQTLRKVKILKIFSGPRLATPMYKYSV